MMSPTLSPAPRKPLLTKRPTFLSVICVIGFFSIVWGFAGILSPTLKRSGAWYPPLVGLVVSLRFMAFVGLWHLKRWGIHLFTYTFLAATLLSVLLDTVSVEAISTQIVTIAVLMMWYKRLDPNL